MQGHEGLGRGLGRMRYEIRIVSDDVIESDIYVPDYFLTLDRGVSSNNIPYTFYPRGRGGRSKYIEALENYGEKYLNIPSGDALRFAFATARVQEKEGNPTNNSYLHSKNGERKNWITNNLEPTKKKVRQIITDSMLPLFRIETNFRANTR